MTPNSYLPHLVQAQSPFSLHHHAAVTAAPSCDAGQAVLDPVVIGIVHDFNNLLFVLSGSLELLENEPANRHSSIHETMRMSVDRAAALTRDLLACARRANRLDAEWVEVDHAICSLQPVLSRLSGGSIEMTCQLAARDARVLISPSLLDRVLMNLVANARDAMPDGGRLQIVTRLLPAVTSFPSKGRVCLEVIDAGVGMSSETRDRIFDEFFTTKNGGRGTGLGMSNVRQIIEHAGGSVEVTSTPGAGTTVRVLLPAA